MPIVPLTETFSVSSKEEQLELHFLAAVAPLGIAVQLSDLVEERRPSVGGCTVK